MITFINYSDMANDEFHLQLLTERAVNLAQMQAAFREAKAYNVVQVAQFEIDKIKIKVREIQLVLSQQKAA